ncbi:PilN domain-containing protein [Oxalobacteraceae bacterium OTU3CAMAD1]|nr:PilN domain-containing protein [Oxalobacteraceae bacterium OTU3CAMAD1]
MSDLASHLRPPLRGHLRPWLAALGLVAVAGWMAMQALAEHDAASKTEQAYIRLQTANKSKTVPKVDRAKGEKLKRWDELRKERAFAWTPIFQAVERSASEGIELLEFRPEKTTGYLALRGEARDQAALVDFLNNIALQAPFEHSHLTYQALRSRGQLQTIEFEIRASLRAM